MLCPYGPMVSFLGSIVVILFSLLLSPTCGLSFESVFPIAAS